MIDKILEIAKKDDRIRAVTMEGSRANPNALHDKYSDFDICFFVKDIREFTKNKYWIKTFGDILIVQFPDDYYLEPYDYNSKNKFTSLIQFKDGNRIDLTLKDISNIDLEKNNTEPRTILLDKDGYDSLIPLVSDEAFNIKRPSAFEFYNTCNEFRWVSLYVVKGICRDQLYYAKLHYDIPVMNMFIKMINWKAAVDNDFKITTGAASKYLKKYLSEEDYNRFKNIFPNGEYEDIWEKLIFMYDFFEELALYVSDKLGFEFDLEESKNVREYIIERRNESNN